MLQKALSALNLNSVAGVISPIAMIHGFRKQGVYMKVVSLTITSSDPLVKCLLPVPVTLCPAVLVPKGEMLSPGNTAMILLKWKLRLPPGYFALLMPMNQ